MNQVYFTAPGRAVRDKWGELLLVLLVDPFGNQKKKLRFYLVETQLLSYLI